MIIASPTPEARLRAVIRLPSADAPAVSLIVLLDGAAEMAERCLRALAAMDETVPCETILLLNDPDARLERLVLDSTEGGRTIVCRANAGPAVGWNLGAAVARAPRLATLHEDSEPAPDWLASLSSVMDGAGAGAVGARLYEGDGSVQNCGWALFSDASAAPLQAVTAPDVVAASEPTPADMLSGAAMLVDRAAVEAAGGWDERFHPAVFGDIDISTACWAQGRPVISVPDATVRHEGGAFDRRPGSPLTGPRLRAFLYERNRGAFLAKWGATLADRAAPPLDATPESQRAAVAAELEHVRGRVERIRSGTWEPAGVPRANRAFTDGVEPVVDQGDGTYRVAPEVERALEDAERRLVEDYCRWLVEWEQELSGQLEAVKRMVDDRNHELLELSARLARTAQSLDERDRALAEAKARAEEIGARAEETGARAEQMRHERDEARMLLDRILRGRTWRTRTALLRALRLGRR
jgi:GT2 family glycosyltransferase